MNMTGPTGANSVRIDGAYIPDPRKQREERADQVRESVGSQASSSAGGAELVLSQQRLISEAVAAAEVRAKAVEEARNLLQTGQLDTPEAAERAAVAILERGL